MENEILNYRYYEMASTSWPLSIKCVTSVFSAVDTRKCDRRPHLSIVRCRFACVFSFVAFTTTFHTKMVCTPVIIVRTIPTQRIERGKSFRFHSTYALCYKISLQHSRPVGLCSHQSIATLFDLLDSRTLNFELCVPWSKPPRPFHCHLNGPAPQHQNLRFGIKKHAFTLFTFATNFKYDLLLLQSGWSKRCH